MSEPQRRDDGQRLDDLQESIERIHHRMGVLEHLVRHQLTIIGCRGKRVGLCRCGWTSHHDQDVDVVAAEHTAHRDSDGQLALGLD